MVDPFTPGIDSGPPMTRALLIGSFQLALLLTACDTGVSPGEMPPEEIPVESPPFQTDSLTYSLRYRAIIDLYEARVWWSAKYHNRRDSTSYLQFCASLAPWPLFQRYTAQGWTDAMASNRVSQGPCRMQAVLPGDSLALETLLYFTGSDFEALSGLPSDSIPGVYRMRYRVYSAPGSDDHGPEPEDLLQLEDRISNAFAVRIRGDG